MTFEKEPFNFTLLLCKESNKIAQQFGLSKTQQWDIIFAHLPPHRVTDFLVMQGDLVNVFKTVSTLATRVSTRSSLEKQINQWRLENGSEEEMTMSLVNLIYLLDKIRDDYEFNPPFYPDLFRKAITVIQRQDVIPRMVLEELDKARIGVVDTDQPGEITQVLFSACQRYLGMKPNRQQVKMIQATPADYERQINKILHQVKAIEFTPQTQGQQKMTDGMPNKKTGYWKAKRERQKQQQGQGQNQQKQGQTNKGQNKQGQTANKGPYQSSFVQPWPDNCIYLSKNGNTLRPEIEAHFNGFCHKCGHSSHKAEK